jgi:hypothetical protein
VFSVLHQSAQQRIDRIKAIKNPQKNDSQDNTMFEQESQQDFHQHDA